MCYSTFIGRSSKLLALPAVEIETRCSPPPSLPPAYASWLGGGGRAPAAETLVILKPCGRNDIDVVRSCLEKTGEK